MNFWDRVRSCKTATALRRKGNNGELEVFRKGDEYAVSPTETRTIEEILFATSLEDNHLGSVVFKVEVGFSQPVELDGSVDVVTRTRYEDLIETMKRLQTGEVTLEEVLVDPEEWKRQTFKHIYGK